MKTFPNSPRNLVDQMGYSEVRCTFCAVSFNIGRLRRLDEPNEAGWVASSDDPERCEAKAGCLSLRYEWRSTFSALDSRYDDDGDATYVYEDDTGDEAYEFESDDNLVDAIMEDEASSSETSDRNDSLYEMWPQEFIDYSGISPKLKREHQLYIVQDYVPVSERHGKVLSSDEHIAGLECTSKFGYSGHNISLDEMKGCTSFQCLIEKTKSWTPIEDDEEFEVEGAFFLSGLGVDMPSRDENSPTVFPARHGAEIITPEDQHDYVHGFEPAMPFHTTCFEIYKHISRQTWSGKIEIQKLMKWWATPSTKSVPNHPDVQKCAEQWWTHYGTEWLVANPVYVPFLSDIFRTAIRSEDMDPYSGVFPSRAPRNHKPNHDPFSLLPVELSYLILSHLCSSDIGTLRLVSRQFEQLPNTLFYSLIRQEMPWLWEVLSHEPPSFWSTTTKTELVARARKRALFEEDLQMYRRVIKEEMPELLSDWTLAEPSFDDLEPPISSNLDLNMLPRTRTNWYELYRAITMNWNDLKGLQNRRRIWSCITHIVEEFDA